MRKGLSGTTTPRKRDVAVALVLNAVILFILSVGLFAQTGRFSEGPLREAGFCVGGIWAGQERQIDASGRAFIPIRKCEWTADGAAISFRQDFLYEDGATRPATVGLSVWDAAANTERVFGVFTHGGIILDATYRPTTTTGKTKIMEFKFVSAGDGSISQWRSVESRIDGNTFTEEGLMLVEGEWKSRSFVTFHRLARIDGAGTYLDMIARNEPEHR